MASRAGVSLTAAAGLAAFLTVVGTISAVVSRIESRLPSDWPGDDPHRGRCLAMGYQTLHVIEDDAEIPIGDGRSTKTIVVREERQPYCRKWER